MIAPGWGPRHPLKGRRGEHGAGWAPSQVALAFRTGVAGGWSAVTSVRRPRVVLAPDAFKGNHDSVQVAAAWAEALAEVARVDPRPISDGGDGFLAVLHHYRPHLLEARARVPDPLGRPIDAAWAWDPERRAAWMSP